MTRRILIPALLLLVAALAWLKPLDELAARQADAGLKRAVASFATARALNAVISVLQGTEVSGGVVVDVKLAPGQVLDPVNDLIEQFSTLMLAASIAFGAQILLMQIGASWVMSAALTVAAAAWAWRCVQGRAPPALLTRVLAALLLVRFIVPVAGLSSELAFRAFMADEYADSQQGIERSAAALGALDPIEGKARWWDVPERFDELKNVAERVVDHSIRIAVVFLLQTLVLPLLVIWILLRASRMIVSPGPAGGP
jgi:hypothetical protein